MCCWLPTQHLPIQILLLFTSLFSKRTWILSTHSSPHDHLFQHLSLAKSNHVVSFPLTAITFDMIMGCIIMHLFPNPFVLPKELLQCFQQCGRRFYPNFQTWACFFLCLKCHKSFHLGFTCAPVRILPGNSWGLILGHSGVFFAERNCALKHLFNSIWWASTIGHLMCTEDTVVIQARVAYIVTGETESKEIIKLTNW